MTEKRTTLEDLPDDFEYVQVDSKRLRQLRSSLRDAWGDQTPIAHCVSCGSYTTDPTRDMSGEPSSLDPTVFEEREPRCSSCSFQAYFDATNASIMELIEQKFGITEENKKTLQALMSIIENPDRVMMVARVQDRVDELERRLEDRTAALRDTVESKMENANSRLFVSSLITNAALFLAGLLFGVVVALIFGG